MREMSDFQHIHFIDTLNWIASPELSKTAIYSETIKTENSNVVKEKKKTFLLNVFRTS